MGSLVGVDARGRCGGLPRPGDRRGRLSALAKHPFEGRRSVVVVFEAHLATTEAQNALLKILEEPTASAVIVLVTEYPDRLLPTILEYEQAVRKYHLYR